MGGWDINASIFYVAIRKAPDGAAQSERQAPYPDEPPRPPDEPIWVCHSSRQRDYSSTASRHTRTAMILVHTVPTRRYPAHDNTHAPSKAVRQTWFRPPPQPIEDRRASDWL